MKIFYTILLLGLMASCTITKRVHTPGWHVEWKNTLSSEKNQSVQDQMPPVQHTELNQQVQVHNGEEQLTEEVLSTENADVNDVENRGVLDRTEDAKSSGATGDKSVSEKMNEDNRDARTQFFSERVGNELVDRPLHTNLKISLISSIVFILCLILLGSATSLIALICLLALISNILTIVFAVKGMREIKLAPETWKGNKLAVFLIVLGILESIVLLILIVFGLFLAAAFGFLLIL